MAQHVEELPAGPRLHLVDGRPVGPGGVNGRPSARRMRAELAVLRLAAALGVLAVVPWTLVAFRGGRFWPLPVETSGSVLAGLAWLVVVDPILVAAVVLGVDRLLLWTRHRARGVPGR